MDLKERLGRGLVLVCSVRFTAAEMRATTRRRLGMCLYLYMYVCVYFLYLDYIRSNRSQCVLYFHSQCTSANITRLLKHCFVFFQINFRRCFFFVVVVVIVVAQFTLQHN